MTAALAILAELQARGACVRRLGDNLHIAPGGALTPELRERVTAHKLEILPLVPPHDAAEAWSCSQCGGRLWWRASRELPWVCSACQPLASAGSVEWFTHDTPGLFHVIAMAAGGLVRELAEPLVLLFALTVELNSSFLRGDYGRCKPLCDWIETEIAIQAERLAEGGFAVNLLSVPPLRVQGQALQ
jgi:hypothetical protein